MIYLNDKNFKETIENNEILLVDFYADWCGPCGMQSKVLDKIQNSRNLDFKIAKVNVDEAPNIAMEYGIESIPTLIVFKDNKAVKRLVGYTEEDELLNVMENINEQKV